MARSVVANNAQPRVALLVLNGSDASVLSPFFGKCDGVLVVSPGTNSREFHPSPRHVPDAVCDLILETGVQRLILGFIGKPAAEKLRANGLDIRLGSCVSSVDSLAANFANLPKA